MEETILTLHPDDKQGVRILKRRYDAIKDAIMDVIAQEGEVSFKDLTTKVAERLLSTFDGSVNWYVVTVKLDLEARGMLARVPGASPQRLHMRDDSAPSPRIIGDAFVEAMRALEGLGTEQNRKVYARHGASDPMFGVSVANLRQVAKDIGKNRELALDLWRTANFDAMALATLIDDPEAITAQELDERVADINYYHLADFFSTFVSKTCFAVSKMKKWTASDEEFVKRCGYSLVIALARNAALMDDGTLEQYIGAIESDIHASPNRAREAMNKALIEIGSRPGLRDQALTAAMRIGHVHIDHGETGCSTPDAILELKGMH